LVEDIPNALSIEADVALQAHKNPRIAGACTVSGLVHANLCVLALTNPLKSPSQEPTIWHRRKVEAESQLKRHDIPDKVIKHASSTPF
jgi:hypothetical protein